MKELFSRKEYLEQLISFKDKDLIKVITGIRRCGKSTLFKLYISYLKEIGVKEEQIIQINFEDIDFDFLENYKDLYNYIKEKLIPNKMNYIFLDEVQEIADFERACDSLYIKDNVDLYITGSNAYMLSGELATLLSGRYVEIKMLPLSFKEYFTLKSVDNTAKTKEEYYSDYLLNSSFPYTTQLSTHMEIKNYLDSLTNTIFVKDIMTKNNFSDITTLTKISKFIFDNIGNSVSSNSIANAMTSNGNKISYHTVDNYLKALTEAFLFHKCERYDVKGKNILKTGEKYYATDIGMRYNIIGKKDVDRGHILENIVYLELLRRGFSVYIGKTSEQEIDFVAIGEYGEEYYQVSYSTMDEKTLERELNALNMIKDHNPKYLLTMDREPTTSYNGVKKINVLDWLLNEFKN